MVRKPTYEELEQRVKESFSGKKEFAISLIDNAPIFFVAIDAQGKTLMMNQLMMKVLGYTANEVVGKDYLSNFVPKKDRDMLASVFRKLTADHEHTFNENHILSKDGKEFLVEWHGTPVFDTSSKLQYFYGIGIDITNRKQIEQALRESEKRFRTLVETMNEGLGVADENSVVTYINDRLSKMIGYSPDEIIGRPIYDFIDETYHELVKEIISERKSGESGSYELVLKRKDNQKVYTILSPSPIFDVKGQYWGSCGVMTDITERKQAEEALKESELNHKTFAVTPKKRLILKKKAGSISFILKTRQGS
jgi:PAS domain S-box-containing protein